MVADDPARVSMSACVQIEDGVEMLKVDHNIVIEDFDPTVFRRQITGTHNCTELERHLLLQGIHNTSSGKDDLNQCWNIFTQASFGEMLSPYIDLTNEVVLTLLLCLYLLSARVERNEFDHHRATHHRGELELMERVEVSRAGAQRVVHSTPREGSAGVRLARAEASMWPRSCI